ncbi:MAG: Pseudomonalisin/xanthomonalisin [Candidatus Eremiobacteraeota bacterium]|nr:Pseudomonalisin/xanthomonalisin [Candidatus Eremiobacteraeota bacterium]
MKKRAALAAAVGLLTASCSGHNAGSLPPMQFGGGSTTSSAGTSTLGAKTTRAAAAVVAPSGWAATATQAIVPANASDLGQLDGAKPVEVVLGLQMRDADALKAAIAAGQVMTRDAFVGQYAPSAAQVSAAVAYLQGQGFTNVSAAPNNMLVVATAPAATVEKAFNTKLHGFSLGGKTFFANTQPAFVPASLSGNVVAVLGLTDVPGLRPNSIHQLASGVLPPAVFATDGTPTANACTKNVNQTTGAPVCPRFYDPATFNITYGVGSTPPATNTKIAIFTVGDATGSIADLRTNEAKFGMPSVNVKVRNVPPTADVSGQGEWTLDMTYAQGMAYNLRNFMLYNAKTFSFKDLTVSLNQWADDDTHPIMNASVGGCEVFPYQSGDMLVGDMILAEAAAQGQTLFASTGDTGGYCGVAGVPPNGGVGGVPMVEYPAASPYAVAVGGTDTFSNVDGTYLGEQAWQSGGGGLSQFEYSPSWEAGTQPVGTTPVGFTFRGLPDVAYDAGIETGALLWEGGTEYITGGTSLSSPMAAGVFARAQSRHFNRLGFAAPLFYKIFRASTATQIAGPPETELIGPYHDILQGTNGAYTALPKYDYTTGLGSIDIARFYAAVGP